MATAGAAAAVAFSFGTGQPPDRRGDTKNREEVTHYEFAIHDFRVEALGADGDVSGRRTDEDCQDVVVVAEVISSARRNR
jgi:hypothetical protein